jgi:methionyl-tRNA formyltransferase
LIRGLSPYPGAWTELQGKTCKLFSSHPNDQNLPGKAPGEWESDFKTYLNFQCGEGHLTILDLQLEGKKRMKVDELLRGWKG